MNKLIHADVIDGLNILDDKSVHILVTSPPYGIGMDYTNGDINPIEYWGFTENWLCKAHRKLIGSCYLCINLPMGTRVFGSSFLPKFYWIARECGYQDTSILISWVKRFNDSGKIFNKRFDRPTYNGCLKFAYTSEVIIVLRKKGSSRTVGIDMTPDEQHRWGVNVWSIQPESDRTHPAPFPIELPHRLIKIFSNPGDTVIDPFIGSGTTMIAAQQLDREFVGIDNSIKYLEQSAARVNDDVEWHYVT